MSRFNCGRILKPTKTVVYGPEGVGKTTLASLFPNPVFVDAEGGTTRADVVRHPSRPTSFAHLKEIVADIVSDPEDRETIVFDTADWIDDLVIAQVCAELNISTLGTAKKGDKDAGWGASYAKLESLWAAWLTQLECDIIDTGKMHITFLAHSTTKKFEVPEEEGQYDRYMLAMDKRSSEKLRHWADQVLFLNYQTIVNVVQEAKGSRPAIGKAQGGVRHIIGTRHCAAYDAKNRDKLPPAIAFDDPDKLPVELESTFCPITRSAVAVSAPPVARPAAPKPEAPKPAPAVQETGLSQQHRALLALMADSGFEWPEVLHVCRTKSKGGKVYPEGTPLENIDPAFIDGFIHPNWERVKQSVLANR